MAGHRDTEEGLDLRREDLEGQARREAWDEHVWQEPSEDLSQMQQTEHYLWAFHWRRGWWQKLRVRSRLCGLICGLD